MTETFLSMFSTPDDKMEEITLDQFKQDMDNLVNQTAASFEQPEIPPLHNMVAGVVCSIKPGDIPEEWPQLFKDLAAYVLQMNDSLPEVFQRQLAALVPYLQRLDKVIDRYWEPCDEGDPTVPAWYRNIVKWADDRSSIVEPEAWQPYVFVHIYEDRNKSKELRYKCEMLLDLWQSNWPDHFRNLLDDIKRYEQEAHNDAAASN